MVSTTFRRLVVALVVTFVAALLTAPGAFAQGKPAPTGKVDINTASQAELEQLPGVGPATAKKIIAGRPFASVADLSKAGVPAGTIAKVTPLVTASPVPAPAAAPRAAAPAAPQAAPTPQPAPAPKAAAPASPPTSAQAPPVKGMVWVNTATGVYHKEGDRYYGKTKQGKYMTEEEAIKAGYRAAKTPEKK